MTPGKGTTYKDHTKRDTKKQIKPTWREQKMPKNLNLKKCLLVHAQYPCVAR